MEILDGIHRIDAEVGGRPLYLFLVLGGERNLLLDAGCAPTVPDVVLPHLASLGLSASDIDMLVITHPDLDHQGGTHGLAQANPGLTVGCGTLDRELVADPDALVARRYGAYRADHGIGYDAETTAWMREMSGAPQPVSTVFSGGETIDLGSRELHVLHVPGHSTGHLALFDTRTRALLSGDCVQGSVYFGLDGTRKLCPTYTDVDLYLQTIELIRELQPAELHGCHWPAARGAEVSAFLDETKAYVEQLGEHVDACLADEPGGLTLRRLIERVNERVDHPWTADVAPELVYSVHGHAARQGVHAGRNDEGHVVYRAPEQ